jgi:aminopeptidase N
VTFTLVSTSDAAARTAQPGAADVGDRMFPGLGNGGYDTTHYTLRLRYPTANPVQQVHGTVSMDAVATQDLSRFNLDFGGDSIGEVRVNGQPAAIDWQQTAEELVITPPRPLWQGRAFSVEVQFSAHTAAPEPSDFYPMGWIASAHGSFTSFQANVAHKSIPVNDHPSDKARWSFALDVPQGVVAVANGDCAGHTSANGRTVWSYEERKPLASELIQFAVGDDLSIVQRGSAAGVTLRDVMANGRRGLLEPAFAQGPAQLQWLMGNIGPFPFRSYGNLGVDALFGYSLETQGLSLHTYGLFDPAFLPGRSGQPWFYAPIMIHEAAHQWYGNSVSPEMWSDMWLNEGWATWWEKQFEQDNGYIDEWGYPSVEDYMRDVYSQEEVMRAEFGPVAQPAPGIALLDNPHVYDGGALVLYALQQYVGPETFRQIARGWPQQFRDHSASTQDFIRYAGGIAGQDLHSFLTPWLYGDHTPLMPGHPDWSVNPVTATGRAETQTAHPGGHAWLHSPADSTPAGEK